MTMQSIAMRGCRLVAGGGTPGALVVFALVFVGLSGLGPAALPPAVAVSWAGRAIARVWGYALA
jgi:hypothetical protein